MCYKKVNLQINKLFLINTTTFMVCENCAKVYICTSLDENVSKKQETLQYFWCYAISINYLTFNLYINNQEINQVN